jgi:helix-turn-helix protein
MAQLMGHVEKLKLDQNSKEKKKKKVKHLRNDCRICRQ